MQCYSAAFIFLEELMTPKSPFEINRPLVVLLNRLGTFYLLIIAIYLAKNHRRVKPTPQWIQIKFEVASFHAFTIFTFSS